MGPMLNTTLRSDLGVTRVCPAMGKTEQWMPTGGTHVFFESTKEFSTVGGARAFLSEHRENSQQGIADQILWEEIERIEQPTSTRLTLEQHLAPHHTVPAYFDILSSVDLVLTLTVHNTSSESIVIDEALQFDLNIGDIKDVTVQGLTNHLFTSSKNRSQKKTLTGDLVFVGPSEIEFFEPDELIVEDLRGRSRFTFASYGASTLQFWNPWDINISTTPYNDDSLPPESWERFLRVAFGNRGTSPIFLAAGEEHTLSVHLSVEPLG
ncbi:hypothetical protein FYJ24_01410 [Actinomycetaceae bacterium WB03_NA08]|uniref:Glucose-6-phosphate 1-epimerase n=1 Tax=Scrofimicrobium canadense TaxID=2652290 RepID=A0A6N7W4Q6_9ACTO|nr:hypothetical protein [Scrofimicrobium canadense]MSS83442.1 hypothetical protein [Scrofimicrobium canadense]